MTWDRVAWVDSLLDAPAPARKMAAELLGMADKDGRLTAARRYLRGPVARRAGITGDDTMRGFVQLLQSGHVAQVRQGWGRTPSVWQLTTRPAGSRPNAPK
jgi:hypothetical protein